MVEQFPHEALKLSMKRHLLPLVFLLVSGCAFWRTPKETRHPALTLNPGDHVCIIGNGFADRMQHSGYLEAMIHAKYPNHHLVFRNLAFAGDEVATRMRSEGFGSPDDWLKKEKADVVWAFFGYNESFKGKEGLEAFKKDLDKFIKDTLKQNYSGKGASRLVLFSPIAAEKHTDPNFPDPKSINENVELYAKAMSDVARSKDLIFVDLIGPSKKSYAQAKDSLTINGVHLTDEGYQTLAPAMFLALFKEEAPRMDDAAFEKLRIAVYEKNKMFFSRYRTMDGYNVYGGRSYLEFDRIKNRDTMQREMEIRDVMTENRDKRVWAAAQGENLEIKDDNLPPPVEVKTNKPGEGPGGTFLFLSGEEAIKKMKVPPGCKVNLFASEEQYPELANPVQMAFDPEGRLWVAVWPNYPERTPLSKKGDSLLVFEDTDGDGKADKVTHFIDDLNCPTGFQFYKDGVIVVQAPDVWFARDTDGDGKADWKKRILNGLDSADSHHTANSVVLDPGGAIYLSDGVFHRTQIENAWGPPVRNNDAEILRFEPRTLKIETYISYGFANPHGRAFDHWGNDLVTDATGNNTYFGPAFSGHIDFPEKHADLKQFWERPSRPCPGTGILSSRHFPEEFQGNFLNCNVIGFQGIYRVKVNEEGSGLWGKTLDPPLVQSEDPNFRPTAVSVAPDGSIYFLDWQNPIIGHMQHHIRDPNRDHTHGRIYRMTYEGRPLIQPPKIAGEPIEKLLELLEEPEDNTRTRVKIELGGRDTKQVIAAVDQWAKQFDPNKVEDQHHLLEALWVHQWHSVVSEPLLRQMLRSPEPRARAQGVRVLGYWRERVRNPLQLLREAANDKSPRVRLEAVRGASFFKGREAMEIAHDVLKYDMDYYLNYTFKETKRQLAKSVNGVFLPKDTVALETAVGRLTEAELLQADDAVPVWIERLRRPNLNINVRTAALRDLAKARRSTQVAEGLAILKMIDASNGSASAAEDLGFLLASLSPDDLKKERTAFSELATGGAKGQVRHAGFAALVAADQKPDAVWAETAKDDKARSSLIQSIGLHGDADFRARFAPMLDQIIADSATPGYVREAALMALPLMGAERAEKNFRLLAGRVREGKNIAVCVRAILQLPREAWSKEEAKPTVEAILDWARKTPASDRSSGDFAAVVQAGVELSGLLPPADAARIGKELRGLGPRVFSIRSVREQMRYDVTRLVVEAGKPFEVIYENTDMMPHNFVVVEPGAREAIGAKSDKMQPTPDSEGRSFIPDDKRILFAAKMIEPGMKERLKITAPSEPGDYEYVCTYPDHWKTMFGELRVVKDVEAYLQNPN